MVDPSRPQSRSGRSTRNHPLPEVAAENPPIVGASSAKNNAQAAPPKTRNRHPSQSNTLLKHGFTKANSENKATEPPAPTKLVVGHKRTRSAASAQDDPPPNAVPANQTTHKFNGQATHSNNASSVKFADDVKTHTILVNGIGKAENVQTIANGAHETSTSTPQKQATDKRTLRSQDGTSRLHSELATYFGNFDEVMNNMSTDPDPLTLQAKIMIVDEPIKAGKRQADLPLRGKSDENSDLSNSSPAKHTRRSSQVNGIATSPSQSAASMYPLRGVLNGASHLDLVSLASGPASYVQTRSEVDPLADDHFLKAHNRGERKEKQMRNQEKEHAQHEKVQLEGLLEALQGPDWLRALGITGITESESKDWKPKRDYFIREVKALLNKFDLWRDEEKRMKAEKDAKLAAETEEEDEEDATEDAEMETSSSDIDASARNQLLDEAAKSFNRGRGEGKRQVKLSKKFKEVNTHNTSSTTPTKAHHVTSHPQNSKLLPIKLIPAVPPGPFTSFYPAPHLRAQALGKQRHGGRKEMAFGRVVPDVADADFVLPKELTNPEKLRDHARKRRRLKRDAEEQNKGQSSTGPPSTNAEGRARRR